MPKQALFMVGEQRSGSNLLRLILEKTEQIAAPHPPHILERLMPYENHYLNLPKTVLIDDVCRLVETNPVPWNDFKPDRALLANKSGEQISLLEIFGLIMDEFAEYEQRDQWVCKSLTNINWLDRIEQNFDSPRYIYLYRDPRDVTLSFMKTLIGFKHPYFITQKWVELQQKCLAARKVIPKERFYSIRYEDLLLHPVRTISGLVEFLGIDFREEFLEFYKSEEAVHTAQASSQWYNVSKPIIVDNHHKFLKLMSEEDRKIVESVAFNMMKTLGYQPTFDERDLITFGDDLILQYQNLDNENRVRLEKASPSSEIANRVAQKKVLQEIKSRFNV